MMRLITRKSQSEYARLCGVAPRVLADVEAGRGSAGVETIQKLVKPFGYEAGIVVRAKNADFRRPTREFVTRTQLNQILTRQIREIEGYDDARISVGSLFSQPDATGCNWSADVTFNPGKGGFTREIGEAVGRIVREARARYNITES